ncbi:hypothetical protein ACHAWU_004996 [Discostella pseudostelligera]|uniref:Transmembrane protein 53 n=1 Tax=Discostella pseudostelligera TaxID=259834 RepID=A0ABD3MRH7_9STRA
MNPSGILLRAAKKPVVVLAGWLGCQPRHLRRYSDMYHRIGWDTIVRIGNPRSVMVALTDGPSSDSKLSTSSESEMKQLAINLLQELHTLQPPRIVLHLFSNNGCFLWEWVRHLLFEQQDLSSSCVDSAIDTQYLKQKLIGVIFDSAPAYYDGNTSVIQSAFQYLDSPTEKDHLLGITKTLDPQVVKHRFDSYWNGLRSDSTNIPQLYLFSDRDALSSAQHIEELIGYRTDVLGKRNIWKHKFSNSDHCAHLLKYPSEYEESVNRFLSLCTNNQCCGTSGDLESDLSGRSRL